MAVGVAATVRLGGLFTVIVIVMRLSQPALFPLKVYTVVTVGLTTIVVFVLPPGSQV